MLQLGDELWALPYRGYAIPHKYPRLDPARRHLYAGVRDATGYALWPRGRLVALECPAEGRFRTIPLRPAGRRVRLNVSVGPTGFVRVGVMGKADLPGRTVAECDGLSAVDGFDVPVTWGGREELDLPAEPVALAFELRQARLFGVEFV